jgi:hypothetical protein
MKEAPLLHRITVEPAQTTGPVPVVAESARRTSPVGTGRSRNDSIIAPVACADRTLMSGWSNVVRAGISAVFPAFTPPVTMMLHRPRTTAARNAAVT